MWVGGSVNSIAIYTRKKHKHFSVINNNLNSLDIFLAQYKMTTTPTSISNADFSSKETINFMGGQSYKLNPLDSLKIVCTSMICGESQYYRPKKSDVRKFSQHFLFDGFYGKEEPMDYFQKIVSNALDFDFEGCLAFVSKLRIDHGMRLNSNVLLTKAVHHPSRVEFNKTNPKVFKTAIEEVGCLPTDWTTQYKLLKESGKPIPTIWKRAIATKLEHMTAYHAAKYLHGSKTKGKKAAEPKKPARANNFPDESDEQPHSDAPEEDQDALQKETEEANEAKRKNLANLVDLIRITHPKPNETITELVKTGKVEVSDDEQTWEKLRSAKKTWQEINAQIRLPHMALLRNLRNIIEEYAIREDLVAAKEDVVELAERLVRGVKNGKQFPFRYFTAYKMLQGGKSEQTRRCGKHKAPSDENETMSEFKTIVLEGLNRCVLESVECIPPMKGRVDCLSDNSGSSRSTLTSEYGSVRVFEIANLSAILTAYRSTEGGSVWIFGDRLIEYVVTKEKPILKQLEEVNAIGDTVGGGTETGVWLFWEKCILEHRHLDTVFIYSDMQAGTGGLYVDGQQIAPLKQMGAAVDGGSHVDVLKLVEIYRTRVFSKVNVFSVQVAGYDNSILPDIIYRGAVLSGWTGKEAKLAYEMSELWDQIEWSNLISVGKWDKLECDSWADDNEW